MWYVFPQFEGLGISATSRRYAVKSVSEARAFLAHPVLGPRLLECAEAVLDVDGRTAMEIFGDPDNMKLQSCATLFASLSPADSVFHRLIEKYFKGRPTLERSASSPIGTHSNSDQDDSDKAPAIVLTPAYSSGLRRSSAR
jgi:uncharacterized protein (DUF1810 family)